jgi:hypothetical protein
MRYTLRLLTANSSNAPLHSCVRARSFAEIRIDQAPTRSPSDSAGKSLTPNDSYAQAKLSLPTRKPGGEEPVPIADVSMVRHGR